MSNAKNRFCFWLAIALILMVTCSPLIYPGMHVYFSAHMITHVVLLLICGPLLVMSIPTADPPAALKGLSFFLQKRSWLAWMGGIGIMWFWHIPSIFNASLTHMGGANLISLFHPLSMLAAGVLFSWPLLGPFPEAHIHPLSGVVYLFTACISCSLLGLLITFAPVTTFHRLYMATNLPMKGMPVNPWVFPPPPTSRQRD